MSVKNNRPIFFIQYLITIFLSLLCLLSYAQYDTTDNSNLISFADKILIKANISTQIDQYSLLQTSGTNGTDLILQSNNEYKCFLSLDYQFIGFSYGFSPKLFTGNDDNALKGKSSFTNYKLLFFPKQWLQTAEFDKVKGFYAVNTNDFVPGWREGTDPYIQIPSLQSSRFAFSTSYIFNRNFSLKNIIYQTEWQKRSAGSFVPTLAYDITHTSFNESGIKSKQRDYNVRLGIGYYYTFIIGKRFFISPNFTPSIGARFSRSKTTDNGDVSEEKDAYVTYFWEGGLKMGFNSDRFVIGTGLNFNFNWYRQDVSSRVYNDRLFGIVYFGYRFHEPRLLGKAYGKLKELVPFL